MVLKLSGFRIWSVLISILTMPAFNASAMGLMEAYEAALTNDSIYHSAIHENEANQQYKVIGRANLLPSVSDRYAINKNYMDITRNDIAISRTDNRDYDSKSAVIQLRQPLVNMESWARYKLGNLQATLSDKQLEVRKQELISRFFGLFANAVYSEDTLALAEAELAALTRQEEANQLMFAKGEGTKTALIESQAKLSLSEAQVIESQASVMDGRNALAAMVGKNVTSLDRLSETFDLLPDDQRSYEAWKTIALENNPEIAAQKESVEIASQEIKRNRAGHLPRLDAVASYNNSDSDTVNTYQQEIDSKSIGLQLNIPIYAGGSVSALTAQAEANYKKAQDDLESKMNQVLLDLRKQYSNIQSGSLKINALKKAVESAELLVTATKKSLAGGVRTNLDLLDARKQLFESKRDLSLARYNYLVAYINLRKAAGVLSDKDIENISKFFSQPNHEQQHNIID